MKPNTSIRIVVLYAEVVGYVVGMLRALTKCSSVAGIDTVFWDKKNTNSSRFLLSETIDQVRFHARSSLTDSGLVELLHSQKPDIIVVSGWMDAGYIRAVRRYRSGGGSAQVVCGIDDQWHGTLRQRLGMVYFRLFYSSLFDFMWVAGKPQYHYAQRLGYGHQQIITNLYSADNDVFSRKSTFSRRFVFIGRFDPVKALDQLLDAYLSLPKDTQDRWPLVLVGDGQLKEDIEKRQSSSVFVKPFMQPSVLMEELMKGGVACITSQHEQWGVAVHEMAVLGFPLVLSSACGAATEFLISGYNGFQFRCGSISSLRGALLRIAMLSHQDLELFSQRSHILAQRITSEHTAYSLLSVLSLSRA